MTQRYPHVFTPLPLRGGKVLKNRVITAPSNHGHIIDSNHQINMEGVLYYGGKAKGGAAMVTLGEALLDHGNSSAHSSHIDISQEICLPNAHRLTDYIHMHGALASIELNHNGHFALPEYCGGEMPMAASAMDMPNGNHVREMNEEDMERVIQSYVDTARMAWRGGFDTVLLHFAHGWLMGGFLSPLINRRKDQYGGSVENRCRFPLAVLQRIRQEVPQILVEIRLSGSELTPGGITLEECVEMAQRFEDYVDLMHISCGTRLDARTRPIMHPSHFVESGHNATRAAAVKRAVTKVPVGVVGAINDLETAERILAEGMADYVCSARAFIADPDWVEKSKRGREDTVRPCIKCLRCLDVAAGRVNTSTAVLQDFKNSTRHNGCSVNPWYGRQEVLSQYPPAQARKKVVVVGGGPAGMQAAMEARGRGHEVILFEQGPKLGGQLFYADYVWFKHDMKLFRDYLIRMTQASGADIRLNTAATPELVEAEKPDAVIVAVGADPVIPPIPGVDGPQVHTALDIFADCSCLGQKVAVIGGGLVGCETALHLAHQGREVTVVEMGPLLAPDGYFSERTHTLQKMEEDRLVSWKVNARCVQIGPDHVAVQTPQGTEKIPADSVVLAAGMRARKALADSFQDTALEVKTVGDCVAARTLFYAIRQGFDAAITL